MAAMAECLGRLRQRSEYLRVAGAKRKSATPGLVLQAARSPAPDETAARPETAEAGLRVGITVSRKVGNAVARNRARRRLGAVARATLPGQAKPGHDYVLVGRKGTLSRPYDALLGDLEAALAKLGLRQVPARSTADAGRKPCE